MIPNFVHELAKYEMETSLYDPQFEPICKRINRALQLCSNGYITLDECIEVMIKARQDVLAM